MAGICVSPEHNAIHNLSIPGFGCLAPVSKWFYDSGKVVDPGPHHQCNAINGGRERSPLGVTEWPVRMHPKRKPGPEQQQTN
jgi:hypothetical protein